MDWQRPERLTTTRRLDDLNLCHSPCHPGTTWKPIPSAVSHAHRVSNTQGVAILPEIMFQDYAFVFWVGFMNCLRCTNIRDWLPAALQLFDSLRKEKEETSSIWFTASSNRTPRFLVFNTAHLVCPEWLLEATKCLAVSRSKLLSQQIDVTLS